MKKVVIATVGGTVLLFGIALLVLPGPAFIVIPAGLAILATEFIWAEKLLDRCKDKWHHCRERYKKKHGAALND